MSYRVAAFTEEATEEEVAQTIQEAFLAAYQAWLPSRLDEGASITRLLAL